MKESARDSMNLPMNEEGKSMQTKIRALLIEDNIDQREMVLRAFRKKDPSVDVVPAENGAQALDALSKNRFDAIILDYSLPRMNGLEVLKGLQAQGFSIPVIMVTGQGDEQIAVESMKLGAIDYIIKTRNYQDTLPVVVQKALEKDFLQRNLEEASQRSRRLFEVSLSITRERNLERIGQELVEGARALMQTQGALFFLAEKETAKIRFILSSGFRVSENAFLGPVSSVGAFGLSYFEKQPFVIEDPHLHPLGRNLPATLPNLRHFLSIPLIQHEAVEGVLLVLNKVSEHPFSPEDIDVLSTLGVHASAAIENARFFEEMEKQATTDSLTGIYNHREFQKRLGEELERATRYGKEFSLLMMDLDNFKVINDTHGHPVGDLILRDVVRIIKKCIRNVDIPSRYGGEEFTVLLPETSGEKAKHVAERIRKSVIDANFVIPSGHPVHVSVSIGVAYFPNNGPGREKLISAADQGLYFAKKRGRNCVCCYEETLKSAIERDEKKLAEILLDPKMKTLQDLATAIDAKSPYTRGHTEGTTRYATMVAEAMHLNEEERKSLQVASLLHNVGIVSLPDGLLNKATPLSQEEIKIIQAHPLLAEMLLKSSMQMQSVLPAVLYHHERFDGNGYPNGLKGEEIPFLARILGVVEAFQAMTSIRPYRPRLSKDEAVAELKKNAGTQFDPYIVDVFVRVLEGSK